MFRFAAEGLLASGMFILLHPPINTLQKRWIDIENLKNRMNSPYFYFEKEIENTKTEQHETTEKNWRYYLGILCYIGRRIMYGDNCVAI